MSKTQVAAYVTEEQKQRLVALAELELVSLSTMLTMLIDEAYELNFADNEEEQHPAAPRGEF